MEGKMATLLLRIAAPLQSWGISSKFEIRETMKEPTKSGIIGMIAAAFGRSRTESEEDLIQLKFGVRVDKEGEIIKDFQMVHGEKNSYVTQRYYLSDAIFLVGLECNDMQVLYKIEYALKHPKFPLFLGRRSCPPTFPLVLGIENKDLLNALEEYESLAPEWHKKKHDICRIIYDDGQKEDKASRIQDVPLSFSPLHRQYGYRLASEKQILLSYEEHDPMQELR